MITQAGHLRKNFARAPYCLVLIINGVRGEGSKRRNFGLRFASLKDELLKLKSALVGIETPKESPDDLGKNGGA
jgi:hypothetical protein